MKILIQGINYSPEIIGIGKYTGEMAEWLANRGHEVRVVASPPYYPAWRIGNGYSGWSYKKECSGGATIFRCPLWIPNTVNGLNRVIHLSSFAFTSFPILFSQYLWKPHIVLNIAPALISSFLSRIGSVFFNAKSWLHFQDFELDAAFNLGILKKDKLRQVFTSAEKLILKRFDRISTISKQMAKNLHLKGVDESRTVLFPNWVDTKVIYPLNGSNPIRAELDISKDTIVALYSGSMGEKQGIEILVEVARKLESNVNIKFVFCGEGSAHSQLIHTTNNLKNVICLPLQPIDRLNSLLSLADIHLLPQRAEAADLVMPSKLTGIFASGRPVITTAVPGTELAQVVQKRGIVVRPNNAEEFAKSLLFLSEKPQERKRLGNAGRSYATDRLNKERILSKFERELCSLVNGGQGNSLLSKN